MDCHIFAAGSYYGLYKHPGAGDYVIACDGGLEYCEKENIAPDLILGDFDSLGYTPEGDNVLRVPVEKDDTDTMLAIKLALEKKVDIIYIHGGTGGHRLDHTIANLQGLVYAAHEGGRAVMFGDGCAYTAIENGEIHLPMERGRGFSVFCLTGKAEGVGIEGGKYSLCDETLDSYFPLGVSNKAECEIIHIKVRAGNLVIGWEIGDKFHPAY